MKRVIVSIVILALASCATDEQRGADYKSESLAEVNYTTTNYDFDGGIQSLVNTISALGAAGQTDAPLGTTTITGVVTTAAKHEFEWVKGGSSTQPTSHKYINHAFWIQDQNAGILVFYDEDYDNDGKGDGLVDQDYKRAIVSAGDKITIDVTRVMKYNAAGGMPIITKFDVDSLVVHSTGNSIYYKTPTAAFSASDIGKIYRIQGTVDYVTRYSSAGNDTESGPFYVEYDSYLNPMPDNTTFSGAAQFRYQVKNQTSFISSITNSYKWNFQLNASLVRGTLDSYSLSEGNFSYYINAQSDVVLTGPVFCPKYSGTDSDLAIAITDKPQVSQ